MKKATYIKDNFEEIICGLLLGIMLLILTYQVVLRFVFNSSNAWSEELARYLFIWFIFIGASYAAQKSAHIKIDALLNIYPEKFHKIVSILGLVVWIVFNIFIVYIGMKYMMSLFKSGKISLGLQLQLGYIYLAIPTGYMLMTIRLVGRLIDRIKNYKGGKA